MVFALLPFNPCNTDSVYTRIIFILSLLTFTKTLHII